MEITIHGNTYEIKPLANLCGANLCGANLCGANLCGANLWGANLHWANLHGADLRGANLCVADLRGANLRGANLCEASLSGAQLPPYQIAQGVLRVWKKVQAHSASRVIELEIPRDVARTGSLVGRKCRAAAAIVVGGLAVGETARSVHDRNFIYTLGRVVRPTEPYNDDPRIECAPGIHFFLTRREAEEY
jgi:hypothetical protein